MNRLKGYVGQQANIQYVVVTVSGGKDRNNKVENTFVKNTGCKKSPNLLQSINYRAHSTMNLKQDNYEHELHQSAFVTVTKIPKSNYLGRKKVYSGPWFGRVTVQAWEAHWAGVC